MSLLKGAVAPVRFLALGPVPNEADLARALVEERFTPFQDGLEEERVGVCDWRSLKITPPATTIQASPK